MCSAGSAHGERIRRLIFIGMAVTVQYRLDMPGHRAAKCWPSAALAQGSKLRPALKTEHCIVQPRRNLSPPPASTGHAPPPPNAMTPAQTEPQPLVIHSLIIGRGPTDITTDPFLARSRPNPLVG